MDGETNRYYFIGPFRLLPGSNKNYIKVTWDSQSPIGPIYHLASVFLASVATALCIYVQRLIWFSTSLDVNKIIFGKWLRLIWLETTSRVNFLLISVDLRPSMKNTRKTFFLRTIVFPEVFNIFSLISSRTLDQK